MPSSATVGSAAAAPSRCCSPCSSWWRRGPASPRRGASWSPGPTRARRSGPRRPPPPPTRRPATGPGTDAHPEPDEPDPHTPASSRRPTGPRGSASGANAAVVVESDGRRRGIDIFARKGARVIAVNDGKVVRIGKSKRLGRFVKLLDVYGNTYTYAHLGKVSETYPVTQEAHRQALGDPPRAQARQGAEGRRVRDQGPRRQVEGQAPAKEEGAGRQGARQAAPGRFGRGPRPPRSRSACSPTRSARTRRRPAAPSSSASPPR